MVDGFIRSSSVAKKQTVGAVRSRMIETVLRGGYFTDRTGIQTSVLLPIPRRLLEDNVPKPPQSIVNVTATFVVLPIYSYYEL